MALMQPFQGWRTPWNPCTQGSSKTLNPGLKDNIPLGWDDVGMLSDSLHILAN